MTQQYWVADSHVSEPEPHAKTSGLPASLPASFPAASPVPLELEHPAISPAATTNVTTPPSACFMAMTSTRIE
jgi:hypothetical protein